METQDIQDLKKFLHKVRIMQRHKSVTKKVRVHCSIDTIKSYKNNGKGTPTDKLATAYFTRSIEHEYAGSYVEAMKDINAALKICKTDPDIYYHKADLHAHNGQLGIVLNNLNKAIKLDPLFTEAIIARNACYAKMKENKHYEY